MTQFFNQEWRAKNKTFPIWFMRQAGRYLPEYHEVFGAKDSFFNACYDLPTVVDLTMQPVERFDVDAAIVFSDILLLPKAMGCNIEIKKDIGPVVESIYSNQDLTMIELKEKTAIVPDALKRLKTILPSKKALIGFAGAPWTIAAYIIEGGGNSKSFPKTRKMAYTQPKIFYKILDMLTEATIFYLKEQLEAGADYIQLFDSLCGILSEDEFGQWVINPTQKIAQEVSNLIGFPMGAGSKYFDFCNKVDLQCISVDHTINIKSIVNNIPKHITIQGNLNPYLLAYGTQDDIRISVEGILQSCSGKDLIFNLGHGMPKDTPVENVEYLMRLVNSL